MIAPTTPGRKSGDFASELRRLAAEFASVGAGLADTAEAMRSSGLPPSLALLDEASACNRRFATLRVEVIRQVEGLQIDFDRVSPLGLSELIALLDRAILVEQERLSRETTRDRALALINRVLGARHRDPNASAVLRPYLDAAGALRDLLASAPISEDLPREAGELVDASHPLAALVRFAEPDEDLGDDVWLELYGVIATAFGKPLAAAAARARIELPTAPRVRRDPPSPIAPTLPEKSQVATGRPRFSLGPAP